MPLLKDQEQYFTMSLSELYTMKQEAIDDMHRRIDPYFRDVMAVVVKTLTEYIDARVAIAIELRYIRLHSNQEFPKAPVKNSIND